MAGSDDPESTKVTREPPKGPRPETRDDLERIKNELISLENERFTLQEQLDNAAPLREQAMKDAKRSAVESRAKVDEIKSAGSKKLAVLSKQHEAERSEDAARASALLKRIAEDGRRIAALEKAILVAKARRIEEMPAFLARLGLGSHLATFVDEELDDVELLRSMGPATLATNMAMLGLAAADAQRMSDDLFKA